MRILLLGLAIALAGCQQSKTQSSSEPLKTAEASDIPTEAQAKLPTVKLYLGSKELNAEVASTQEQMRAGLMFRKSLGENDAMIFIFPWTHRASFWMKNTELPLSVAYINPDGIIEEIHDLQPHNTNAVVAASDNIQFVLEVNQGWFKKNNIDPGTLIRTEHGSLKETFLRR
jgi:uncharacterized membrane protein (UPF0127 family)